MSKRKSYPPEFREEAINLAVQEGIPCVQVERELGISAGAVSRWIREKKRLGSDAFCGSGNVRPSQKEYKELQKAHDRTKRELEILKKAVAIFSREKNPYSDL